MALCYDGAARFADCRSSRPDCVEERRDMVSDEGGESGGRPSESIKHCPRLPTGEFMSLVKGLLKTAIVIKLAEVAQRELSKPENQRKIKEGIRKFQDAARSRR